MAIKQLLKHTGQPVSATDTRRRTAILGGIGATSAVEAAVRLTLALVLSSGRIVGTLSPFAVGFVASSGRGISGAAALTGALLGYFLGGELSWSLKYITITALVYVTSVSFRRSKIIARGWFMPSAAAIITAVISAAYSFREGFSPEALGIFLLDVVLVFGGAYLCRIALSPWEGRLGLSRSGEIPHTVSVLFLVSALFIAISGVELFGFISLGRILASLAVLLLAYRGGAGAGAICGVAFGLAMDAATDGTPFFIAAYGICGLVSGIFARRSRLIFTVVFVAIDAALSAVSIESAFVPAILYEVFSASVFFMIIPQRAAARLDAFLPSASEGRGVIRSREYVRARLETASGAFRDLFETVSAAAGEGRNDEDIASVFDAAADAVCRKCAKSGKCWHSDYNGTVDAMNNASAPMLRRGRLEREDFPDYFSSCCQHMNELISAVNGGLRALFSRRQYRSRLHASRNAAYAQYSDVSEILHGFSQELGSGIEVDLSLEDRLRKYLKSEGIGADSAVFRLPGGRLRAEINGTGAVRLTDTEGFLEHASAVLGVRLCAPETSPDPSSLVLLEAEPLSATVGIACLNRHGHKEGGDRGAYFKTDEGMLYVILSDGMGTGEAAGKYSSDAVRILERFIRAGVRAETAMKILGDMMLLKNEDDTGCATVDLICIDLFSGSASMYKYGAAPSYLKRSGGIKRVKGDSFAAGLSVSAGDMPDRISMELKAGSVAVMVSDGVTCGLDDRWLSDLISESKDETPRELARHIIRQAAAKSGREDDMTAFVISVSERK